MNKFILFYSFSNLEIQNIVKPMNTSPLHTQSTQQFYPQNIDRKRTTSAIGQLSSTSRQNLQVSNRQNILNHDLGYQKINMFASNQPTNENFTKTEFYGYSHRAQPQQATKFAAQNAGLKRQLQRQKQKYQLQIKQLRRNLTLKDQLLDQCEKQIFNLKSTYLKLIDQYQQFKDSQEIHRPKEKQQFDIGQKTDIIPRSPEGSFLPLSIMPKRNASNEFGKLSHGLIKGRV